MRTEIIRRNINDLFFVLKLMIALILFCIFPSNINAVSVGESKTFSSTSGIQAYPAPASGYYKLEVWGAQGGKSPTFAGGYGAYSVGVVYLDKDQILYVVVGGQGGSSSASSVSGTGGYNGGGAGGTGTRYYGGSGGGGATHIALKTGLLSTFSNSIDDVLIVAGGGGGAGGHEKTGYKGGNGGGISGVAGVAYNANVAKATGGNQTSGYAFGLGQRGRNGSGTYGESGAGGGGGGFYGGKASQTNTNGAAGGGGGSGYIGNPLLLSYNGIKKAMYCYSCSASSAESTYTVSNTAVSSSAVANTSKTGSGAAKITLIELTNDNAKLASVTIDGVAFSPKFDPDTYEYYAIVNSEKDEINIEATAEETETIIAGTGKTTLYKDTNDIIITGTAESGNVATYVFHITRPASSYKYLKDIKVNGTTINGFSPETLNYTISVPYTMDELNWSIIPGRASQQIFLPTDLSLNTGFNRKEIVVVSEDGTHTTSYILNINREHSSKLKSLTFDDYDLNETFNPETLEYTIDIMSSTLALKVNAIPYDEEAKVTYSGFGYIKTSGTATITVTEPNSAPTVYRINISKGSANQVLDYNFPYSGATQTFTAPATGFYKLETWGAEGGRVPQYTGGYGAYSTGVVYLKRGDVLYVTVGGKGGDSLKSSTAGAKGYNGGGQGGTGNPYYGGGGGGGATHIATSSGLLSSLSNDRDSIIIVAGGGGGAAGHLGTGYRGGDGGGYVGVTGKSYNASKSNVTGGTQSSGYAFGLGGNGRNGYSNDTYGESGAGGGGGGFYGGRASLVRAYGAGGGGGGSGYIANEKLISYEATTKAMYCYNCTKSNAESTYTVSTTKASATPTSYYAKSGDGYAKITLLAQPSENNFLSSITVKGTHYISGKTVIKDYTPSFNLETEDYYVTLDVLETSITLIARPEDSKATISGLGTFEVPGGTTDFEIVVTSEAGTTKTYTIHVTRPKSNDPYPLDIIVNGLVPSLCNIGDGTKNFCSLNPAQFDKDTQSYYLTVPYRIKQLYFNVHKGHPYQNVSGEGKVTLTSGENIITIEIESEDGQNTSVYTYYVTRDMTGDTDIELEILDPVRDINFDPDVSEYYITVDNSYTNYLAIDGNIEANKGKEPASLLDSSLASLQNTIQMYVRTDDENASFITSGPDELSTGMNEVDIIVTSANGEIRYYVLNIYRLKNENVFLSTLEVTNDTTIYPLSPEFNKINLGPYQTTVANNVTEVTINAKPEAKTTKVSGTGKKTLAVGNNKFEILVTAENGTVEMYVVNVIREKNSNANLTSITVKNGETIYPLNPIFNEDTLEYNVMVPEGTDKVEITATPEIETTTYKLLDNGTIKVGNNIKRVKAIAEDGTSKTYTINITRPASSNNNLTALQVSNNGNILNYSPTFNKEKLNYTLEVENEISYVDVAATKEDSLAKITGTGKYNLKVGENIISVTVTSETNDSKAYVITITRKPNSNPYLSNITTSDGIIVPKFKNDTLKYTINVPNEVDNINISATPEVSSTKVTGTGTYSLEKGENNFELITLAEDGISTLTYELTIIRDKSANNNIKYLLMEEGAIKPTFDPNIVNYSVTVPYEVTKGTFHVELADSNATYEIIGNDNFIVGEQDVIIRVTSEKDQDADIYKDYIVKVTRQEYEEASDYLSSLDVSDGTLNPPFRKEQQYYTVEVPYDVPKINVIAIPEESTATVSGDGDYSLAVGINLITVTVTSKEGTTRDYQISVERAPSSEARLSSIVINGSSLSPTFDKDTYNYTISTTEPIIEFSQVTTIDPSAFYEIDGVEVKTGEINIVTIKVTAPDLKTEKTYTIEVNKLPSNNNNLIDLEVENYSIRPNFSNTTTLYYLDLPNDVTTINIIANAEDPNATITGDGLQPVNIGVNQYVIEVTSESGISKAYTIIATKKGSNNNNLADLDVLNGTMTPTFNGGTNYNVVVPFTEESLDLKIILEDNNASYIVSGNELKVGNNTVTITVTAENGEVKNYVLNVTREEIVSALLENIIVKNYALSPSFDSYINTYSIVVNYETESLDLTVIPLDKKATYTVSGNSNFVVGNNTVTIDVTSSDGNETEQYILNVTRQAYANTFLDYLYTDQGDFNEKFEKTTLEYTIDVPHDITEIELIGEAVDKSTTVTGLGLHSLTTGKNIIPVQVTALNGTYRIYYVTVNRDKSDDNFLETLTARVGGTYYNLNPEFERTQTSYTVTVPIGTPTININGTLSSDTSNVTGFGMYSLQAGENNIEITVTSESGKTRTYNITVIREANDNNMLIDLIPSVGTLEPNFGYYENEYTLNLDSSAALLSFDVVTEDPNAKVTGISSQVVPDGTSTREIIVTAENGDTRTYTITINKERTDNARLKNLYVIDYPFEGAFNPDVFEYHIKVPNLKSLILSSEVVAIPEDPNAKITKSGNVALITTSNIEYIVTVTAPDGFTKQNYKIIIEREKSNNNLLSLLSVNIGYLQETFYPDNFTYSWVVPKKTILTPASVLAIAQDAGATIEKTARLTVTTSSTNKYIVKVTSEDGSSSTEYILNIVPDLSTDANLASLVIDKGYYEPVFNENIYEYRAYEYVDVDSITVTATPNSEDSEVTSGNGVVELTDTITRHEIIVTAEDGTTETYILNIYKTIPRDEGLFDLHLFHVGDHINCTMEPLFETDTLNYKIKVPHEYDNLSFMYVKMNQYQTVKFKSNGVYFNELKIPVGITNVEVEVYDGLGKLTRTYTVEVERPKSNNNYLKSLTIDNYNLEPEFDKTNQEYTIYIETDVDEVEIDALPENDEANVYINGYNYLQEGNNDATITVTAPDGSTRTYIVHIIKNPEYSSYIKNITVSTGIFWDLTPKFKPTTFEYTTTITHVYDKAIIEAVPVDPETTIIGTGEYELKTGSNIITLTATARKNGATSIYTINVVKLTSNNVDLASLIVEEGDLSPVFDKGTTKYDVSVDEDVESLTIHAIPVERTSTVTITGNEHLQSGVNKVNVIVMNKDKTASKTYQLTVYKNKSSNNYLSNLRVYDENKDYKLSPEFNRFDDTYNVTVPTNVESVTIEATAEKEIAIVNGNGKEYLDYGLNTKTITITAENGDVKFYTVNIYREYDLYLKDIVTDRGTLTPEFDKNALQYRIEVPNDVKEITIDAEKSSHSTKVTLTGPGTYDLNTGENEILLTVSDPDNHKKVYKVIVNRAQDDNNYIKELTVNGIMTPYFDRATEEYQIDVRKEVTSLDLQVTLESPTATYQIINNSGFTMGTNPHKVTIRVTAENGATRDYDLLVNLRPDEFFSNRLLDIKINYGTLTPDFNPDINNYAATVANSISELTISVIKEDEYATVSGDGKVALQLGRNVLPVTVTNRNGDANTYYISVYRNLNSDATLSNLVVKDASFYPIFNRYEENYNMSIDGSKTDLNIIATPTDPNSTVEIKGDKNLSAGTNIVTIKVTAPDGITTKTYTLTVNKGLSTNNYLSDLKVNGFEFQRLFDKTYQGPYMINVDSTVNSIVVEAIPEVSSTSVDGDGVINLTSGQNIVQINATSESGDIRTYTIVVNKSKSSDNTLKDIILSDEFLSPEFDKYTLEYTVTVPEELEIITVTGIPNDPNSTVKGNGTYNITDDFTIYLEVTSEDGNSMTYKVNIERNIEASSKLEKLVVKDGELYPGFHKLITSYTILVPNEIRSLDMDIVPVDKEATYVVLGNENFKLGNNTVTIRVTSKDGSNTTDYTLSVVRQSLAATYLQTLEVENCKLNPNFEKTNMYYEVTVPIDTTSVVIYATAEDPSATVTGTGVKTLNYGENRFYVTVQSASGVIRSYQVVINRTESSENLLLTLESDKGTFDKEFDPEVNEYTLTLPPKTTEVNLSGTISENASVIGLGNITIDDYTQEHTIIVTSQTGEINNYLIHIIKEKSDNTELESLIPSSGNLEYSNDILEYEIEVEGGVNVISFSATPVDKDATVFGTDVNTLAYGNNDFYVIVTAEDGVTKRTIKITVKRMKELISITPSEDSILLGVGEDKDITYTLDPEDTSYPEVEWHSLDESIATVDENGKITGIALGSTEVQIISTHNNNIIATIVVNVINKKITSSIYTIVRPESSEYFEEVEDHTYGAEPMTSIEDFIPNFDNNPDTLFIFDAEGNEITDPTTFVGTKMVIKLIIEGEVFDELTIIIKGDLTGDGYITMTDYAKMKNSLLNSIELDYIDTKSGDIVADDDLITMTDYARLKNYLLNTITSVNED